jgi:hypothetical protein
MRYGLRRWHMLRPVGAILGLLAVTAPSAAMAPVLLAAPMVHLALLASSPASLASRVPASARNVTQEDGAVDIDAALASRLDELRAKEGNWQWADLVERGRIAIGQGDFAGAAAAFETATKCAPDTAARAMTQYCWATALIAKAQSLPSVKVKKDGWLAKAGAMVSDKPQPHPMRAELLRQAGELLNETQQSVPTSAEVAALRVTAWSLAGETVERMAAEHQARVLDPSKEGTARCDLFTIGVIALIVFASGKFALETFEFEGYLEPHRRLQLLKICDTGARTTGGLLSGGAVVEIFAKELVK